MHGLKISEDQCTCLHFLKSMKHSCYAKNGSFIPKFVYSISATGPQCLILSNIALRRILRICRTRISGRQRPLFQALWAAGSPYSYMCFPSTIFFISSYSNTIIISRLHFLVIVFVDIMRACRNRFFPHFHADVILHPVDMWKHRKQFPVIFVS